MWKQLKRLVFCFCLCFSVASVGICSEFSNLTEVQMLQKLQANLIQVQSNNAIVLKELNEYKVELAQVKINSEATIASLQKANELLKSYSKEQKAKIRQLKLTRALCIVGGLALACVGR